MASPGSSFDHRIIDVKLMLWPNGLFSLPFKASEAATKGN
jgi:hypothetical protein